MFFSKHFNLFFSIPSAYLNWTCVHLHFQYIIKKNPQTHIHKLPFPFPLAHKRTHREGTLLSAQCMFSLHIQYIIFFARTKTPVPYFIKWSQGSFYLRAYESVLTKTWYSSQAHPHCLSQWSHQCCLTLLLFFAFILIERYRYIKTDSWRCSICAESLSRSIKNGNINAQLAMGKSIRFLIMLSLGEDHTGFTEDTSNSILPHFPQQGSHGLLTGQRVTFTWGYVNHYYLLLQSVWAHCHFGSSS